MLKSLKNLIRKLDKYSPWPTRFPFAMSPAEKSTLIRQIRNSHYYLEFGMGGSTFSALKYSSAKVYSVDSSVEWLDEMKKYWFIKFAERRRCFLHYVNIGNIGEWGFPKDNTSKELFPKYSSDIFARVDKKSLDTVLIDGRFRVACVLKTIIECSENDSLQILIHDFWNREEYGIVLKYLLVMTRVDTLGVFRIKKNIDMKSVKLDYEEYKYNPA